MQGTDGGEPWKPGKQEQNTSPSLWEQEAPAPHMSQLALMVVLVVVVVVVVVVMVMVVVLVVVVVVVIVVLVDVVLVVLVLDLDVDVVASTVDALERIVENMVLGVVVLLTDGLVLSGAEVEALAATEV